MGNSSGYTREIDHHKKIITGKRGDTMTSERQLLKYCVCKRVFKGGGGGG